MFISEVSDAWRVVIGLVSTTITFAIALYAFYPGKKISHGVQRQVLGECPSGGRHRLRLSQEHLGRGQIAYRTRCSKCNREVGFGFDQIG